MVEESPEVNALEPRKLLNGGHDPRELGRRGAAAKEAKALARIGETREALAAMHPDVVRTLGEVLTDARDAERLKAALGILDRTGIGPHSTQDVNVNVSLVETWAAELDVIDVPATRIEPLKPEGEMSLKPKALPITRETENHSHT